MKKLLSMILALLVVACSLPAIITSYAEDSDNLLADATYANGKVSWTTTTDVDNRVGTADAWGSTYQDNKINSVDGGYSWAFGLGDGKVGGDTIYTDAMYKEIYAYVYIKADGLKVGEKYDFSYYYQEDYIMEIASIKTSGGDEASFTTPVTVNGSKARSHKVSTTITVSVNGDYVIALRTNRNMRTTDCAWSKVILSDLVLTKLEGEVNLLKNATSGAGDVTWTANADAWGGYNGEPTQDSTSRSVNGGYSWTFGMGNTSIGLPTNANPAYITVKAKGLAAETRYDFSFIYQGDYAMALYSIVDSESTVVEPEFAAKDIAISGGVNAHQVVTTFVAPTAGDYTITIVTSRDMHLTGCGWSNVILSDLVLMKNTNPKKFPAEVLVSGNGTATVSDELPAVGSVITFTATPFADEEFLGWYNNEEKVSDELVYSVTVTEAISLTAKFTSNTLNILAGKKASDWIGYRWTQIADSTESRSGGPGYLVSDIMWQSMYTKVLLDPNTEYSFSFNWKSVANGVCPGYPVDIMVYSADDVDIDDRYNNWSDHGESGRFEPKNATDLETGSGYTSEAQAKTYEWQSLETTFTTTSSTEYYVIIYFSINGGANHQAVNLSDFVLKSNEKDVPTISDKDASEWSCFEWSSIENSDVSRYGGKAYLVNKAMYQNIFTNINQLKPNTKYQLSFEWKSVANDFGPAFPNDIFVVAKDEINMWDTTNPSIWNPDTGFLGSAYDLEKGGIMNLAEQAATLEWQNTTVTFTTKEQTDYSLLIHFQASGNGEQQIYLSDFKLEEIGSGDDDDVIESENLAANYTNANGHVTWDAVAGAWESSYQDNKANSVEGGYSWTFGLPDSDFYNNPSYVTIKTDSLKANRKYEFSYIYQADYVIVFDSIAPGVEITKQEDVKLLEGDRAHRITVQFTTSADGPVNIKLKMGKFMNNDSCMWSVTVLSDLGLYDITNRVYGSVKSELGGSASGFDALYCTRGDEITLTATPRTGNIFAGWYDENDTLVSSDAVYTFIAENDFNLLAKFTGSNIPNSEWLTEHGMDGTFEDGLMDGWKAEDRDWGDDTSWAGFERTDTVSYNGDYSLRMRSRYRTTFFNFTDLKKNTKYHLSFYIMHPDLYIPKTSDEQEKSEYNEETLIRWFGITAGGTQLYSEQGAYPIKGGTGWYKINIYFATADQTEVEWNFYYSNKDGASEEFIYMDDVSLVEYTSGEFTNGNFADGAASWRGDFNVESGVASGKSFYQNVAVGAQTNNTVTFRAKGKGIGGASEIIAKDFNAEDYISSESVVNIDSEDWETYSFNVYSGVNPDMSVFFEAAADSELLVDDVTITKHAERDGAIVENIDFESERFTQKVASDVFEIYTGTEGDPNVRSGKKSLKFNAANAKEGVNYILQDAFVSLQIVEKLNYRLTLYYKTTKGNSILLTPEYCPTDDIKTVYTATSNGWTKVQFIFGRMSAANIKVIIGNVLGKTNADFYIDDITLSIAPPMVVEKNSDIKYCEWPLNLIDNQGFEEKITNKNWANLPKNAEIRKGGAFAGEKYLRLKAGTKYIFPVPIATSDNYYFSISTRLGKNSAGTVSVASDAKGTKLYGDENGVIASKIKVDTTKWNRDSFLFSTGEASTVYLVFEVTKGYIDIDEVHFYKRQYGHKKDPNDHSKFVPYNYDNPDPKTVVVGGGDPTFGGIIDEEDSWEDGDDYDYDSPATGDSLAIPVTLIVVAAMSFIVAMMTKQRFFKKSKGGKA